MEMRIYNPDVQTTDDDIRGLLANYKVVLMAFGFKMEVTTQLIQRSTYQKTYFFFKTVECSQVPDVNKEIDSLIKGNTTNEHLTRVLGITLEPHLQPRGPFLENADNFLGPFYFCCVCIYDPKVSDNFEKGDTVKVLVNEAKLTGLFVSYRKCAAIQQVLITKYVLGSEKLPGLSRNGPLG